MGKLIGLLEARLRSQINTNTLATDWILCQQCQQEYRPSAIKADAICARCHDAKREANAREELLMKIFAESLGGKRAFYEFTFENFKPTNATRFALEACKAFNPDTENLYLFGDVGTGKTHLATAVARIWLMEKKRNTEITKPSRFLRMIRGKSGEEESREIERLARVDCLVLDDLGVEKDTEYAIQILYEVIDSRYMACKNGLIVTSNLSLDEIAKKIGDDRLTSRLAGMCKMIALNGEDWRMKR